MEGKPQKLNILKLKGRLLLTVFGSYDNEALIQLNRLKECLVKKGFARCRLVSDYPFPTKKSNEDNDQYFRRKSIYWLEKSDSCIFVFLHDFNNEGVAYELKHTCDHLESKLTTCLVAIESKCVKYSTSLVRGSVTDLVKQRKINRRFFKGESQLCKFCSSAAISFMKELRYYLLERGK